jgi:4-hydroxy-tetrahydrodipicolinate synthase
MFDGAITAIVTPFQNGKIDEAGLRDFIDFQIENGIKGIVPCGTTGESPTLSHKEHERVVEITIEQVAKRVPVIAGAGSNCTDEAISLTSHAKKAGADAALLISPYYNKPTQEGLYRHFEAVAKAVDIPIILYNVPTRTSVNIEPVTIARLSKIDNIVGVKEAAGSIKQIMDIISLCPDDFDVISGEDFITFPLLSVGGRGVISVASNVAPREVSDMCDLFLTGRFEESRKLFYRLLPLLHGLFIETNPGPVKAALVMTNRIGSEELRLPLVTISKDTRERLTGILQDLGLLSKSAGTRITS